MKERILYEDEFERQLKEKADQFKMYPSDKVWNEVHSSLHTRRRRFIVFMSFLIGGIMILAGTQFLLPSKNNLTPAVSKNITEVKPPAEADLSKFTAKSFTGNSDNTSAGEGKSGTARVPFIRQSVVSETISPDKAVADAVPVKSIANTKVKTLPAADLNIPSHAMSLLELQDAVENTHASPLVVNNTADLKPEKSITQSSRARTERFSWEIYVTPSYTSHYLSGMNYQTMSPAIQSAPIMMVHIANVSGFVDNTPSMGYSIGGNFLYHISKNISLKAGLDLTYSRYNIKTYNSYTSQASPALNSYIGYVADSLRGAQSGMGSFISKNPKNYQNQYYQLSVPVGVEMKVAGKGRVQLHIGATVQPSYLLNTNAYVLSEDYNSYVKNPDAFRRWNLSAGGEVFISYGMGNIRWELGPQVRYQIFSTYRDDYPLRENMLNYGIRIGISKTIR